MATQMMLATPPQPVLLPPGDTTRSLPEMWDDDARERMIVERAMRPRSWEREEEG